MERIGEKFFLRFFMVFMVLLFLQNPLRAEEAKEVTLEAEVVAYDERGTVATAKGSAVLNYGIIRIYSDYMEYDVATQEALAEALPGKSVTIFYGANKLSGQRLVYHLETEEGVLDGAKGEMPAGQGTLFVRGKQLDFAPVERAAQKGWISQKSAKRIKEKTTIGKWRNTSLTTCPQEHPHYNVTTKKLTIIPGKSIVAKNPKVYIGGSYLFTYPFDYVVALNKEKGFLDSELMPTILYTSDKGFGAGYSGPIVWDDGGARLGFMMWSKKGLEGSVSASQNLQNIGLTGVTLFGNLEYSWEETTDQEAFRPSWGFRGEWNGWRARLWWSQREALDIEKGGGESYKNLLYRDPEFTFSSPSWPLMSWMNTRWSVAGSFGSYEERRGRKAYESDRMGLGITLSGIGNPAPIRPFWASSYWHFRYDGGDDEQKILWLSVGAGYKLGPIDARTAYRRRWVDGHSPMVWDRYSDLEEFYQQFAFPVGKDISLAVRSAYNVKTTEWFERAYILTYDPRCCLQWQLIYRDDLKEDDDWVSVRLVINAFPDKPLAFGDKKLSSPFPF
ncbi:MULTISPECIES: LPS-assembly protein LptD [Aminobacterium]|uniref:LPS-assembly protein LptD n=3 Tax=Aminobacteriaceae TaxID=3029087 RepID=UPI000464EAFB|nr:MULTISPECIES: LPS-assembly protein LptD [Aminobacterium]